MKSQIKEYWKFSKNTIDRDTAFNYTVHNKEIMFNKSERRDL